VLDTGDLRQHLLGRRGDHLLDVARRGPGNGISTLAIVTLICGSSSRGVTITARCPAAARPAPAAA